MSSRIRKPERHDSKAKPMSLSVYPSDARLIKLASAAAGCTVSEFIKLAVARHMQDTFSPEVLESIKTAAGRDPELTPPDRVTGLRTGRRQGSRTSTTS